MRYAYQQEVSRTRYAEYNSASRGLELARIKCRLAELKDQHEPLNEKSDGCQRTRELMYAAAFFAVVGRWPEEK
tara:strand:+ start:113328 stop:113549 length:222 start_codon:yes stop_codon:yes gene_type:complete